MWIPHISAFNEGSGRAIVGRKDKAVVGFFHMSDENPVITFDKYLRGGCVRLTNDSEFRNKIIADG